jgi:hypothetical protein
MKRQKYYQVHKNKKPKIKTSGFFANNINLHYLHRSIYEVISSSHLLVKNLKLFYKHQMGITNNVITWSEREMDKHKPHLIHKSSPIN